MKNVYKNSLHTQKCLTKLSRLLFFLSTFKPFLYWYSTTSVVSQFLLLIGISLNVFCQILKGRGKAWPLTNAKERFVCMKTVTSFTGSLGSKAYGFLSYN